MKRLLLLFLCVGILFSEGCRPKAKNITSIQRKEAANFASEAQFAVTMRDYARAEELFAKAAEACPDTGDYWINLGFARRRLDDRSGTRKAYTRAVDAYRDAYERDPKQPDLVLQQVYAFALLGKIDEARSTLEKARKKHPDNRAIRLFVENKQLDNMLSDPGFKELAL